MTQRAMQKTSIPNGKSTRVTGSDHFAYRNEFASGKVGYAVVWGIMNVHTGETVPHQVNSSISYKQALYFKSEIMRQINAFKGNYDKLPIKRVTAGGTRLIDMKALIDQGVPDADYYADDEGEMYGYGRSGMAARRVSVALNAKVNGLDAEERW